LLKNALFLIVFKLEDPKQYEFEALYATGEVVTVTKLITDEGITPLDFDV
jgi:hypothetical protein